VKEICGHFLGIDPARQWIPVRPAQHYTMGGVRTDRSGHSPTLAGLFAVGEAACWDMHGFNRLGGNSLAETVVAGMIVGEFVADWCEGATGSVELSTGLAASFVDRERAALASLVARTRGEDAIALRARMQSTMTDRVGIFRTGDELEPAVSELRELLTRSRDIAVRYKARGANPELVTAYRVQKMLKVALCVACGALARTESRGAHFREDHPRRDDAAWLRRTLATWPDAAATQPTLRYEALDVDRMELPPGWRGYGARDFIEHPHTAKRAAEVDAIRASLAGAGRAEVQRALMPFAHLLPPRWRGANERIDQPLASQASERVASG
jgi:fumarate reductase flavoprotein subunit